jgi:hypothetical protein
MENINQEKPIADENKQQTFPSLDLVFELAKEKLHLQSDQWNAINSKNAIVLVVYGIIPIYLGAGENCFLIYHKYEISEKLFGPF